MNKKAKNVIVTVEILGILTVFGIIIFGLNHLFSSFEPTTPKVNVTYEANTSTNSDKKEKSLYTITPGFTYYVDKGAMKLYADIIPMNNGNIFVIGEEFHNESYNDTHMEDASIKEELYYQGDNVYMNSTNNLVVTLTDSSAIFKDNRQVALAFTGELKKINKPITSASNEISEEEVVESEEVDIATKIDTTQVSDIKVDEYSTETSTSGTYVGKEFEKYLVPSYEKTDLSITAKYIETATNNGVKYQEIHSGKYFYVFGGDYKYDSAMCNTVTITGTYRGIEQHFNGLQMDSSYPCFVIKNMRKPTKEEVGE